MQLPSNTVSAVRARYQRDLAFRHGAGEVRAIFSRVFNERLGWDEVRTMTEGDARLSESELLEVILPLKRLVAGEPVQYVLGITEFLGLRLQVDRRVLIPRPETEELVQRVITSGTAPERIVDVCTGSGCMALALKHRFPQAQVTGTDVSLDALAVARANAARNGLDVLFVEHDARAMELPEADLFVCNPPYVPISESAALEPHVRDHEPHLALFVDDADPLLFYRTVGAGARRVMRPGAVLWFEAHRDHAPAVADLLRQLGWPQVEWMPDLAGEPRFVCAR